MHAAVYLRQSKDQHGTGLAVDRQREDCLKLCAQRGWEPVEYVDNDISAYKRKKRPAYERMLKDIEAGQLRAVVVYDLDRLHRRPVELEHFIDLADQHRLALATVSGDTDLSTDNGRLFARIKGAVARAEGERKSARQKRAALQAVAQGRPAPGPRCFGYDQDGMTVREPEAKIVRRAYASLLAGTSLYGITREMNASGFTTTAGRPFKDNGVRFLLLNPRNAGLRAHLGEIKGPAAWPPIVDRDTYDAAKALLTDDERRTNRIGTARQWLLVGLMLCGRCNDGTTVRVTYRDYDKDGKRVRVYRCRNYAHIARRADFCDSRVSERVIARLSRDDARDLLIDDDREDLAELRREAETLRLRLDQLADAFADGTINTSQLRSGSERLRARLANLESRMVHMDRAPLLADLVTASDVRKAWENIGLDRQRAVIDLLYTVTLLPGIPGKRNLELESVRMVPKTGEKLSTGLEEPVVHPNPTN
jgi:DNA invertase Pin-like site-specific DNA recombinase